MCATMAAIVRPRPSGGGVRQMMVDELELRSDAELLPHNALDGTPSLGEER